MDPNAQFAHARDAIRVGDFARAEGLLRALDAAYPGQAMVLSLLGVALRRLGRVGEAAEVSGRAAELAPQNTGVLVNYGNVLLDAERLFEAEEVLRRVVLMAPGLAEARVGLSRALTMLGRLLDAADVCREGLGLAPDHPKLLANLGAALLYAGESASAIAAYERGARLWAEDLTLAMGLAAALNYAGDGDAGRVAEAHRRAGALIARQEGSHAGPSIADPDPDRRLRVGLMCADFRVHASAFFLEPILRHADRGRVGYVLYSTGVREDEVTRRLAGWAEGFHRVGDLAPAALAGRVRADGVDVLLDLSGYADGQRLAALQRRCAPVQGTYLGYAGTTGLPAMDVRLVDGVTDPAGVGEALNTERLVRLEPCLVAYARGGGLIGGEGDCPATSAVRAEGPITFGSFRGLQLLTEHTLRLWTRVLRVVPGSRLLVKNHGLKGAREREALLGRFARVGTEDGAGGGGVIDPSRLLLEGPARGTADMLRQYARVDIALDAFPYSATTTVCESLSMGVPMVTRAGETSASRVAASVLRASGLAEMVGEDDATFVRIARDLALDGARLAALRRDLPGVFAASVVCDGASFAGRFEAALRDQWRRACGT